MPLIAEGKIKIKHGVEIDHFTSSGVIFSDGTDLQTDAVIFA